MSGKVRAARRISESGEDLCAVCSEVIALYAVGKCDHFVCYRCCTRMRSLCEQMYCAICRTELPKVAFVRQLKKFAEINTSHFLINRAVRVYFENETAQNAFNRLLEHKCDLCSDLKPFRTFPMLKDHMRKDHNFFYCDLCVTNLKLFSHERKCYDRKKLAEHRRVGDADDRSHKGHPLCEFCMERFLDNDELARHLRKEHYFCHFCDADGISNQFYNDYPVLEEHFQHSHYLCQEGECLHAQFTNAFRSNIDLRAHIAAEHVKNLHKTQQKQARTLDIDFNIAPRPGAPRRDRRNEYTRNNEGVVSGSDYQEVYETHNLNPQQQRAKRYQAQQRNIDREAENTAKAVAKSLKDKGHVNIVDNDYRTEKPQVRTSPPVEKFDDNARDFPTLDGKLLNQNNFEEGASGGSAGHKPSDTMAKKVARANKFSTRDGTLDSASFPVLGIEDSTILSATNITPVAPESTRVSAPSNNQNKVWKNPNQAVTEDFPALGISKRPIGKSVPLKNTWVTKAPPVTVKSTQSYSLANDYPTLGGIGGSLTKTKTPFKSSLSSIGNSLTKSSVATKSSVVKTAPKSSGGSSVKQTYIQEDFILNTDVNNTSRSSGAGGSKARSLVQEDLIVKPSSTPSQRASNINVITRKEDENKNEPYQVAAKPILTDTSDFPSLGKTNSKSSAQSLNWGPSKNKAKKSEPTPKKKENPMLVSKVKSKNKKSKSDGSNNNFENTVDSNEFLNKEPKQSRSQEENFKTELQSVENSVDYNHDKQSNVQNKFGTTKETDFPSLKSSTAPPGFSKCPPPGFNSETSKTSVAKPPPGFTGTLSNMYNPTEEEEKFSPPKGFEVSQFIQPPNFYDRNKCLISAIQNHVKSDDTLFGEFKLCSGQFRTGDMGAFDYYGRCSRILGKDNFKSIFSELVTLLPDIVKQNELLQAHNTALTLSKGKKSGAKGKKMAAWSSGEQLPFTLCTRCGQVLDPKDVAFHQKEHSLDTDFPSLGSR